MQNARTFGAHAIYQIVHFLIFMLADFPKSPPHLAYKAQKKKQNGGSVDRYKKVYLMLRIILLNLEKKLEILTQNFI